MTGSRGTTTKRRVTMRSVSFGPDGATYTHEAVDYVPTDILDVYVADAQTRWQYVEVSEEPDAGPGGHNGATWVPQHLNHPLAGHTFPATTEEE